MTSHHTIEPARKRQLPSRNGRVALAGLALLVGCLVSGAVAAAATSSSTPANPPANITPSPNFLSSGDNPCVSTSLVSASLVWASGAPSAACDDYVFSAVNNARAEFGESVLVLPINWSTLTIGQQLFVLADMERVGDGYPPYVGLNSALSAEAQRAAQASTDPTRASGFAQGVGTSGPQGFGGAWFGGGTTLEADYVWMYDDGWGGNAAATSNIACKTATAAGCWAHRDELLGSDPSFNPGVGLGCTTCEMGTGDVAIGSGMSYVDLVEVPAGSPPATTFSWATELPYFPGGLRYAPVPSVTTTTLVPSSVPAPVLSASKSMFTTNALSLRWSMVVTPIVETTLVISSGSACVGQLRAVTQTFRATNTSLAPFTSKNFFSMTRVYSARLLAVGADGTNYTGSCVVLGKP